MAPHSGSGCCAAAVRGDGGLQDSITPCTQPNEKKEGTWAPGTPTWGTAPSTEPVSCSLRRQECCYFGHGPRGTFHDADPPSPSPPSSHPPTPRPSPTPVPPCGSWVTVIPPSACPLPEGFPTQTPVQQAPRLSSTKSTYLLPAPNTHTHTHTPQPSYSDNLLFHILYSRAIASREKHESSKVTMTIRGRNHERRLTYPSLL